MGKHRSNFKGLIFVALGVGLMITFVFPYKFIVVLLAILLIICGVSLCKN